MAAVTASVLNNFADVALSLPQPVVESTLKQNSAIVDVTGYEGKTALQKAVYVGNLPLVNIFLQYGADPNLRSKTGETAVHFACGRGKLTIVVALLKYGGDPTILDGNGRTAIHCAAMCGSLLMVQYLVEVCEVDIEAVEAIGVSALQIAVAAGHLNLVSYLVKKKKVNRGGCDNVGNNVLHLGVLSGVSGVCWEAMYPGAEHMLNQTNQNGLTPLMLSKTTKTLSQDLKKWMEKWTRQYNKSQHVESPMWPWLQKLLLPFICFHIIAVIPIFIVPSYEWLQGLPGLLVLLSIMGRQGHRIAHPSRWPNPIYLGAYTAGLVSTLICFFFILHAYYYISTILTLIFLTVLASHLMLFYVLLSSDPGVVRSEGPLREVLRGVGEGVMKSYCIECQLVTPPLSYHCKLCQTCHHNMDHHCLFLNTCIARNNHWHFVIFIITNLMLMFGFIYASITITTPGSCYSEGDLAECLTNHFKFLLGHNIYTFLMIFFNLGSMVWGFALLRGQLRVIGSQQTTLIRIKCGDTDKKSWKEWSKNVWTFLMKRKVSFANQSHYFNQV